MSSIGRKRIKLPEKEILVFCTRIREEQKRNQIIWQSEEVWTVQINKLSNEENKIKMEIPKNFKIYYQNSNPINPLKKIVTEKFSTFYLQGGRLNISPKQIDLEIKKNRYFRQQRKNLNRLWGRLQAQMEQKIHGVLEGHQLEISLYGVGYRAIINENELELRLGYSHRILVKIPSEIKVFFGSSQTKKGRPSTGEGQKLVLQRNSKESLGQFAVQLRRWRQPEPYKGKGVLVHNRRNDLKWQNFRKTGKRKT